MSSNYLHHEMFPLGADTTPYRLLTARSRRHEEGRRPGNPGGGRPKR